MYNLIDLVFSFMSILADNRITRPNNARQQFNDDAKERSIRELSQPKSRFKSTKNRHVLNIAFLQTNVNNLTGLCLFYFSIFIFTKCSVSIYRFMFSMRFFHDTCFAFEVLPGTKLWHRYFPVNFPKFLSTPFFTEQL